MGKNHDSNPFLFPSDFPSYPSESTTPPSSSSSPTFFSSRSTSSIDSPYKSSSSPPRQLLSGSSSNQFPAAAFGPCGACKFHNRRCSENCCLASFLPPNEVHKFAVVDSVFGSGNVGNFLQQKNNSSYIPLLLLLKDTSQEDNELNLDHKKNALSEMEVQNELGVCVSFKNEFRIRELIQELKVHLDSAFSDTDSDHLVNKILSSFEKSLSILNWSGLQNSPALIETASNDAGSPICICDSPGTVSVNFDGVYNEPSKKRKLMPTSTQHVRVSYENEFEGPFDDGYKWTKYGQKDVLGVKYPRLYYRCNYRLTTNCMATKQVQRMDEEPIVFEITYRGVHTCSPPEEQLEEQNNITSNDQLLQMPFDSHLAHDQEIFLN